MDGMSLAKIDRIIEALRYERLRWTPVRRVNIPKPNRQTRALGIPTGPDKLLQEVIRMILEAYYEPQFSDRSHGFNLSQEGLSPPTRGNRRYTQHRSSGVRVYPRPRGGTWREQG